MTRSTPRRAPTPSTTSINEVNRIPLVLCEARVRISCCSGTRCSCPCFFSSSSEAARTSDIFLSRTTVCMSSLSVRSGATIEEKSVFSGFGRAFSGTGGLLTGCPGAAFTMCSSKMAGSGSGACGFASSPVAVVSRRSGNLIPSRIFEILFLSCPGMTVSFGGVGSGIASRTGGTTTTGGTGAGTAGTIGSAFFSGSIPPVGRIVSSSLIVVRARRRFQPFACGEIRVGCLDREIIAPFLINFLEYDRNHIAELYGIRYFSNPERCDFRNVHQTVFVGPDLYERAEVHHTHDRSFEALTYLVFACEIDDLFQGSFGGAISARDEYGAVVFDRNVVSFCAFLDTVNHFAAWTDDEADLINLYFGRKDFRCTRRNVRTRLHDFFCDDFKYLHTCFLRLRKGLCEHVQGNAVDFHVHLNGRDTFRCSCDLEVHIAVMIFGSLNVGQNFVCFPVGHHSHRDACDRSYDWNASIHE